MNTFIREGTPDDVKELNNMIQHTIDESYKWVYSEQVRDIFKRKNTKEEINKRVQYGYVNVALDFENNEKIIGTGSLVENRIFSVYVRPEHQGNGVGISLMQDLERQAAEKGIKRVVLNATVSSKDFYEKLGYKGLPKIIKIGNEKEYIVYDMEKSIL